MNDDDAATHEANASLALDYALFGKHTVSKNSEHPLYERARMEAVRFYTTGRFTSPRGLSGATEGQYSVWLSGWDAGAASVPPADRHPDSADDSGLFDRVGALERERRSDADRRADDATGFNVVPQRYSAHGRETIDRLRDAAPGLMITALSRGLSVGDAAFAVYCALNAMKYSDRLGLKGPPEEDQKKIDWYREMWDHVLGRGPDPRQYRPEFTEYVPHELESADFYMELLGYSPKLTLDPEPEARLRQEYPHSLDPFPVKPATGGPFPCTCIGLPPMPARHGTCPVHTDR